jgi:hypothetical protein
MVSKPAVPLIMHVPARLRDLVAPIPRASASRPTLPPDATRRGYDVAVTTPGVAAAGGRTRRSSIGVAGIRLASSAGRGRMLRHNGRTLYTADAVDGGGRI